MDKRELNEIIHEEKRIYIPSRYHYQKFTHSKLYVIWKMLSLYRKAQYYKETMSRVSGLSRIYARIAYRVCVRKKNIFSEKCGIEIANGCKLGRRLRMWHGGVVINADLGDDCMIHGNNILGNKGVYPFDQTPTLGNNVDVGVGAVIIGKINIADNCRIGANAVVTKSFDVSGSVVVGVPAKILEKG